MRRDSIPFLKNHSISVLFLILLLSVKVHAQTEIYVKMPVGGAGSGKRRV